MKVSLNKANRLRNQLAELAVPLAFSFEISSDETLTDGKVQEVNDKFVKEFDELGNKYICIHIIRTLIDDANHKSGVSKVIAEIASLEKNYSAILRQWETIQLSSHRQSSVEMFRKNQQYNKERAERDKEYVTPISKVSISSVPEGFADMLKEAMQKMKLEMEEMREKRNELNGSTQVELPLELVEFLRKFNLMKEA